MKTEIKIEKVEMKGKRGICLIKFFESEVLQFCNKLSNERLRNIFCWHLKKKLIVSMGQGNDCA